MPNPTTPTNEEEQAIEILAEGFGIIRDGVKEMKEIISNSTNENWEKKVIEAINGVYPKDIFPDVSQQLRNGAVAQCMREMAPSITAIVKDIVENHVATEKKALLDRVEEYVDTFLMNFSEEDESKFDRGVAIGMKAMKNLIAKERENICHENS